MKTDDTGALRATSETLRTARGEIACIRLDADDGASALVSLHGAQVLSWIPGGGRERLFLGARASAAPGDAIRGGIPVIFPQFAARGPLPKHGFARTRAWEWTPSGGSAETSAACFFLRDDAATRACWPHAFVAQLRVALRARWLHVTLDIRNTGADAFDFTCALHAYLRVDALASASLDGVADHDFIDSANGGARARDTARPLRFVPEIDRIYPGCGGEKRLHDSLATTVVAMRGFTDTVVWNPGAVLAAAIDDLAPDESTHFVCVEAACIEPPLRLEPGATWSGTQRLSADDAGC